jgi:hypothetical protein
MYLLGPCKTLQPKNGCYYYYYYYYYLHHYHHLQSFDKANEIHQRENSDDTLFM